MDGLRERLLQVVTELPGAHTRQAAAAVGVPESSADYHLRRLVKEGKLLSEFSGRTRHWYARGCGLCPVLRRAVPMLRREEARACAAALDETPATAIALATRAGVTLGTARWTASVLHEARLLARVRNGRVALRPGARTCLEKAVRAERCNEWGRCPVSVAFLAEQAAAASTVASAFPSGSDGWKEGYTRPSGPSSK